MCKNVSLKSNTFFRVNSLNAALVDDAKSNSCLFPLEFSGGCPNVLFKYSQRFGYSIFRLLKCRSWSLESVCLTPNPFKACDLEKVILTLLCLSLPLCRLENAININISLSKGYFWIISKWIHVICSEQCLPCGEHSNIHYHQHSIQKAQSQ